MANRPGQWRLTDPANVPANWGPRSTKWAWLEIVLPLFSVALLIVFLKPEHMPKVFLESANGPMAWVAWAAVGAMGGVLAFSGLLVCFFLLYSPLYLVGKSPMLVGKAGWTDRREVRFYGLCFLLLCVLLALLVVEWRWFVAVFILVTGFAPTMWRALV